ncbi:hypothetical protein LCGC14_1282830 [marine sediment metagenome]|uniref:Uncharacterized protein n=1 Tax=marine sediment metagenome TaxID=412755 RepID=A0A0F9KWF4_9ZZZZ
MKNIWKYALTVIISVALSWVVLQQVVADESAKNRHQLQVYFVDAQSSTDLMRFGYSAEIQRMQKDMRKRKDMLIYLWLESQPQAPLVPHDEEIIDTIFEPREIWCFVQERDGSNMINLEACIVE